MATLIRTTLLTVALALICACSSGGGGNNSGASTSSSSSSSSSGGSPPEPTPELTINGTAAKGILQFALVTVHPVTGNGVDYSTELGSTTTDRFGEFSVEIFDYDNQALAIDVRAASDNTTAMICDLIQACGFGWSSIVSDSEFNLEAIVPAVNTNLVNSNVNVVTTAAAHMLKSQISTTTNTSLDSLIEETNVAITDRFGVSGNATQIQMFDLSKGALVAAASANEIKFNLFNAAIIEGMMSEQGDGSTISGAIAAFASQYTNQQGIADLDNGDDPRLSFVEILNKFAQLASLVDESSGSNAPAVSVLGIEATVSKNRLMSQGSQEAYNANGSNDAASEDAPAELVAGMIEQLDRFGSGVDLSLATTFSDNVLQAQQHFGSNTRASLLALGIAAAKAVTAWEELLDNPEASSYTSPDGNLDVAIQSSGDASVFAVTGTLPLLASATETPDELLNVQLRFENNGSTLEEVDLPDNASAGLLSRSEGKAMFLVSGRIWSNQSELNIEQGEFTSDLEKQSTRTPSEGALSFATPTRLHDPAFSLQLQIGKAEQATFEGQSTLSFQLLKVKPYTSLISVTNAETAGTTLELSGMKAEFSGRVNGLNGQQTELLAALENDRTNIHLDCYEYFEAVGDDLVSDGTVNCSDFSVFKDHSITTSTSLPIDGLSETVRVLGSVKSEYRKTTIEHADQFIQASRTLGDEQSSYYAINQDQVELNAVYHHESDTLTGNIQFQGTTYADITRVDGVDVFELRNKN